MIYPVDRPTWRQLFTPLELLFWAPFCGLPLGGALAAHRWATGVEPQGWAILWAAVLGMWGVCAIYFRRRWASLLTQHFWVVPPTLVVGWEEGADVDPGEVAAQVAEVVRQLTPAYPGAEGSLRGCLVHFRREWLTDARPGFMQARIAGVQDNRLIVVRKLEPLSRSALRHELAHRVLQVCAGDPPVEKQHALIGSMGWL